MTIVAEAPPVAGRPRRKPLLQSESFQGFALISPTFLYALVLLVVPILVVIAHSFWTQHYLTIDHTFTLENYRQALFEPIYRDLLGRSLYISLTTSIATVVLAYPIGLGLAAGAMIFVVSHEVIPETHRNGHQTPATLGLMAGFAVMLVLDTALG